MVLEHDACPGEALVRGQHLVPRGLTGAEVAPSDQARSDGHRARTDRFQGVSAAYVKLNLARCTRIVDFFFHLLRGGCPDWAGMVSGNGERLVQRNPWCTLPADRSAGHQGVCLRHGWV